MHTFWLSLVAPGLFLAARSFSFLKKPRLWALGLLTSAGATVGWMAIGASGKSETLIEWLTLGAYQLVSSTDLPLLQVTIGMAAGLIYRCRSIADEPKKLD